MMKTVTLLSKDCLLLEKYQDELEGKGQYMRHIKFFSVDDIDEKKLVKLMKMTKEGYRDPHPKKK